MLEFMKCMFRNFPRKRLKLSQTSFKNTVNYSQSTCMSLLDSICSKIEATGPISVSDYMKEALVSPQTGYYMTKDVFGVAGDFITSPEISQVFGELIGVWFYNEWQRIGKPQPLQLVEFGPGRGILTDDILRVFTKLSDSDINLSVHFIEVSPFLCQVQATKLCSQSILDDPYNVTLHTKHKYPISWYPHLTNVPTGFSFFLAHEFFDALPIHKFQKTNSGWREVLIDCKGGELQFVISRNPTPASKLLINENDKREHVEISPEACILLGDIMKRMREDGGISLIVDYGHMGTKSDTFRSFKDHQLHDPLKLVGEADLTADVDFQYLSNFAKDKAAVLGPVNQSKFLKAMGIQVRLEKLLQSASAENQTSLKSGCEMLLSPTQMGERYKFLALYPLVLKDFVRRFPPPGF